jgi:hypothetical protein
MNIVRYVTDRNIFIICGIGGWRPTSAINVVDDNDATQCVAKIAKANIAPVPPLCVYTLYSRRVLVRTVASLH